jgi:tetratricopeptide (TPR) repeat protein
VGVRASFDVSVDALEHSSDPVDRRAAAAFGLLSLPDGPKLGVAAATRLLDRPEFATKVLLERLVDVQLLQTSRPGHYHFHDLVRLYARERAAREQPEQRRTAALLRLLGFYTATAWCTLGFLRPGDYRLARADHRWSKGGLEFADHQSALGWLEAERANLLAAVRQAAAASGEPAEIAVQLAQALFGFFMVRNWWQDCVQVNQTALELARGRDDRAAEALAHNDLGGAYVQQGRYEEARASLLESLRISKDLGDRRGQAATLGNLGVIHLRRGRYQEALAYQRQSLKICRQLGDRRGQAACLGNLSLICERQGRYREALAYQRQSLKICRQLGDRLAQANSLADLGIVYQRQGRYREALACQQESLEVFRELGDRYNLANVLLNLGIVHQLQGRYGRALACHAEGLAILRELGDRYGQAQCLRELGVTLEALGRTAEARAHWWEALAICEALQIPEADEVRARLATPPTVTRDDMKGSPARR